VDAGLFAVVSLGSNLGDREGFLALARQRLRASGFPWTRASRVLETEPIGGPPGQGPYLNQLLAAPLAGISLSPGQLLRACQAVEAAAGRVRRERWGPRTLDVDVLTWGNRRIRTGRLIVPHPALPDRPFLRVLLDDLGPGWGKIPALCRRTPGW